MVLNEHEVYEDLNPEKKPSPPQYPPHQCEELKKTDRHYAQRHPGWALFEIRAYAHLKDRVILDDCKICTYCGFVLVDKNPEKFSIPPYPPHQCEGLKKIDMWYSQRHTGWILVKKRNRPLKDKVILHDCKVCTYCEFVFEV